jgi:hypothetical protein
VKLSQVNVICQVRFLRLLGEREALHGDSRAYQISATRAGRRVEVSIGRNLVMVAEVGRGGGVVRTARSWPIACWPWSSTRRRTVRCPTTLPQTDDVRAFGEGAPRSATTCESAPPASGTACCKRSQQGCTSGMNPMRRSVRPAELRRRDAGGRETSHLDVSG